MTREFFRRINIPRLEDARQDMREIDGDHELAHENKPQRRFHEPTTLSLFSQFERDDMKADQLNQPIVARLESEIITLRGALNLSRERAEDAEADLAEARREITNQTNRAEAAEHELGELKAEQARKDAEYDQGMEQWRQQIERDQAAPVQSTALSKQVAEYLLGDFTPEQLAEADKIAADLNDLMAANAKAKLPPVKASPRKRKGKVPA